MPNNIICKSIGSWEKFRFSGRLFLWIKKKVLRGGKPSPGLDKIGYPWDGGNINTWPGVLVNNNGITESNHFKLSKFGVPVGGVVPPRSTSSDPSIKTRAHIFDLEEERQSQIDLERYFI